MAQYIFAILLLRRKSRTQSNGAEQQGLQQRPPVGPVNNIFGVQGQKLERERGCTIKQDTRSCAEYINLNSLLILHCAEPYWEYQR